MRRPQAPRRLRGGTRQRVGLARTFIRKPRALILDGPNVNLDFDGEAAFKKGIPARQILGNDGCDRHALAPIFVQCNRDMIVKDGTTISVAADIPKSLSARRNRPDPIG